jgi:hypothetical protein
MKRPINLVWSSAAGCVLASLITFTVATAEAQKGAEISIHAPDSVAFVVARRAASRDEPSIQTFSREVTLILRDSVVILQLTDRGLEHLFDSDRKDRKGGSRFLMTMVKAGLSDLFDHGVAYRISALSRAYSDGSRIILEDREGGHVFETTTYNDHRPMEEFSPGEARRFTSAVQKRIHRR